MNKRSLRTLEYDKILELLSEYANSEPAKHRARNIKPRTELAEIEKLQSETRDAYRRLERHGNLNFSGIRSIRPILGLLKAGATLSAAELLDIAGLLETAAAVKSYGDGSDLDEALVSKNKKRESEEGSAPARDSLTERFDMLVVLHDLSAEIRRCIISTDEIADDASGTLAGIRRKIKETDSRLHRELEKIIRKDTYQDMLQDSLITSRGGRYCIPVKQEYRSRFPGMIHDQSQSGSTLFIEPMAVVNMNNEIKELENDERTEIEHILETLSASAATFAEDIEFDLGTLIDLDFIFAKGKFARAIRATEPAFNTDGIIEIKEGRHPLLDRKAVVPIDLTLGRDYHLLIVTGPNTGGKTVSLKTLGLFTLMGQAGLHIPAAEGSVLSVMDDVFADIGDEQSIEMSLSTFSSHMSNIVYILEHATDRSLCLFDELGGGTDPVEGAALAEAILDELKNRGTRVMATTHYNELKTYAMSAPLVENASCEFDVATLRPTYKLHIGIPGSSNAFAISKKLGISDSIIESARGRIGQSVKDMEELIASLTARTKQAEEDAAEAAAKRAEAEEKAKALAEAEAGISEKKADILEKAREEARELLDEAKETADRAIRDYNKWLKNPNRADAKEMEARRGNLRDKIDKLAPKDIGTKTRRSNHKAGDFHIGDTVLVLSLNSKGHITALPDAKGKAEVRMGIINSKFHISDLSIIDEPLETGKKNATRTRSGSITSKAMTISPEINVIGKTVDEATAMIDKYIDDAALSNLTQVTIIHGKGTGALRKGIHQFLDRHPLVKSYRAGEYGEGEYGVTIVSL